jgi:hypothetical protein
MRVGRWNWQVTVLTEVGGRILQDPRLSGRMGERLCIRNRCGGGGRSDGGESLVMALSILPDPQNPGNRELRAADLHYLPRRQKRGIPVGGVVGTYGFSASPTDPQRRRRPACVFVIHENACLFRRCGAHAGLVFFFFFFFFFAAGIFFSVRVVQLYFGVCWWLQDRRVRPTGDYIKRKRMGGSAGQRPGQGEGIYI